MRFNGQSLFAPGQIFGTTTNDNAAAGKVGQIIESTVLVGAAVALTNSATAYNVTSIPVTAGDWDVWGNVVTLPNVATTSTYLAAWISTTSATLPTFPNEGAMSAIATTLTTGVAQIMSAGQKRISIAATTTIYLSVYSIFAVSTNSAYGHLIARRAR